MANLPSERAFLPAHAPTCREGEVTSEGIAPCDCGRPDAAGLRTQFVDKRFDRGQPVNKLDEAKREVIEALRKWAIAHTAGMHRGLEASSTTAQPKAHAQHLISVLNLIEDIKGVKVE